MFGSDAGISRPAGRWFGYRREGAAGARAGRRRHRGTDTRVRRRRGRIRCQYRRLMRWRIVVTRARRAAGAAGEEEPDEDDPGDAARLCAGIVPAPGRVTVTGGSTGQGSGHAVLVAGVALLRPEEQVLEAMLAGWPASRPPAAWAARPSAAGGDGCGPSPIMRGCSPWLWTAQLFEEWCADLALGSPCGGLDAARAGPARSGCSAEYLTDPVYAWAEVAAGISVRTQRRLHPVEDDPPCRGRRISPSAARSPSRSCRCPSRRSRRPGRGGRRSGRKGGRPVLRDAVRVKTAYAFGAAAP